MASIGKEDLALKAYFHALFPLANPLKSLMECYSTVESTPPMLGIFNNIPWHQLRESDVEAWARAGFTFVINDGEHRQWEGHYGEETNRMLLRYGILPVQRLHREALSQHGDAFQLGARATMRPYSTTVEHATEYYKAVNFPVPGKATYLDRGGYPVKTGAGGMAYTPAGLRDAETETQGWLQFETEEYILDQAIRDQVLSVMAAQGEHRACGFIGPFDAILRAPLGTGKVGRCRGFVLCCCKPVSNLTCACSRYCVYMCYIYMCVRLVVVCVSLCVYLHGLVGLYMYSRGSRED
jgi:hypothetical protein